MKIAYIVPSLVNKGPIIVVNTIIKNLINKVERIDVYYFDDKFGLDFPCETYKIDFNTRINFEDYDIVHSHGYRPDKYVFKWRNDLRGCTTVTTIHSDIACDLKYSYNVFISMIYTGIWLNIIKKFGAVVVISQKLLQLYGGLSKNVYRIYNGIDIEESNIKNDIVDKILYFRKKDFKIIGTYAVLTKIKGIEQLIRLLTIRNDLVVVIIGQGKSKKDLVKLGEKLKVSDRILYFDYLPKPYNYLSYFDVYAICSRSEGFGLALVEAAFVNAAIVASNIEIFHEIFDEEQITYFELDNQNSLSQAIDIALSAQGCAKKERAKVHAIEWFSGSIMADNYLQLYKNIVKNGRI